MGKKIFVAIVILILLAGNTFLIFKYLALAREVRQDRQSLEARTINVKVLEFAKLFVEKVLNASQEVDFETRLKLENAVRDLKDREILGQWQKFTASKTEPEAQAEVKNLLNLLINKIKI